MFHYLLCVANFRELDEIMGHRAVISPEFMIGRHGVVQKKVLGEDSSSSYSGSPMPGESPTASSPVSSGCSPVSGNSSHSSGIIETAGTTESSVTVSE